jgi:hypothetical protein
MLDCHSQWSGLAQCGTVPTKARTIAANILLVVDKSGSMSLVGTGSNLTKWQAIQQALASALGDLAPYAAFGLELFPARDVPLNSGQKCDDNCCRLATTPDVAIGPGTTTVPQILEVVQNQTGPGGQTPTAKALALAEEYFQSLGTAPGKRLVFLITDGGPNCSSTLTSCAGSACTTNLDHQNDPSYQTATLNWCDDPVLHDGPRYCLDTEDTVARITALKNQGVNTVVIGIPGSEPYESVLTRMAEAGGEPNPASALKYYRVVDNAPTQLTQVFMQAATELITSCDILLDSVPGGGADVNVAVDCQVVNKNDASGAAQWQIDASSTPVKLKLLGDLCTKAETSGIGRVDILVGCPTIG